ncbi:hypothetical protein C8Z91_10185 [Paenibacillus elgii]|uniref:ABC transporter permease n=1 Tax=Paenibacillus elgii TaxID=189691 RepID=A0A2T6G521_9BACL|nr:ABC transporter permease subunit [Paenibacillus elgii]PUA39267.1 hypothetical protein C8Z91_10185 [Paenibacillus elgii]
MLRLMPLVQNESMKIFRRWRTWVMAASLVVFMTLLSTVQFMDKPNDQRDWKTRLAANIQQNEQMMSDARTGEGQKLRLQESILRDRYAIEHDIPVNERSLWTPVTLGTSLITLITIFTIVVAADNVAGEFSGGTIKLILIRPAKRWKVLLSKYIASLGFALFLLVTVFAISWILGIGFYGLGALHQPVLDVRDGMVIEQSMVASLLQTYALNSVSLVMMATFGFMISTVFRSSSFAIGGSIALLFVGTSIVYGLREYPWVKYVLFAHLDLTQYLKGKPLIEGMTLGFSVTMLLAYFVLFMALSFFIFGKRDVAA